MNERVFIKGFNKDLKCRGYQFEIGKEYKIDLPKGYKLTKYDLCSDKVFHFCDSLSKVHYFYSCYNVNNRYCIIEVLGQFCENGDKCGSDHIRIVRELTGEELEIAKGLTNGNTGLFNSGNHNSGWNNSGHHNSGWCNSGDYNSGNSNIGHCNSGFTNFGDNNSGMLNSGDYNTGDYNSGSHNSGHCNSGHCNSGHCNSGNHNSGLFNSCNHSNGIFCNKEPKICIFNIQTDWTFAEFQKTKYYSAIISSKFPLTEWKEEEEKEKKFKINSYKKACKRWWEGITKINRNIIKSMPNFDIDVFCDITGIPKEKV